MKGESKSYNILSPRMCHIFDSMNALTLAYSGDDALACSLTDHSRKITVMATGLREGLGVWRRRRRRHCVKFGGAVGDGLSRTSRLLYMGQGRCRYRSHHEVAGETGVGKKW